MFPTAGDYNQDQCIACQSVLVEVIHLLGDYTDDIAVIGGWVPSLLLPGATETHVGTMDVDIAINGEHISSEAYTTIHKILLRSKYKQSLEKGALFKYFRQVTVNTRVFKIEVDLITGEYGGDSGKNRRHELIQDVMALKARGTDLVFGRTKRVQITADLPDYGGKDTVVCNVADVVPFIVMKAIVLARRKKEKDAYDLVFVLRNYPGSSSAIAELLKVDINNRLVLEALSNIRQKFSSPDDYGPTAVAAFLEITDKQERDIMRQRAYQTVQLFLNTIQMVK